MPRTLQDAALIVALILPAAASSSTTSPDLFLGPNQGNLGSDFPGEVELLITIPAVATAMLPDTKTLTLQLQNGAAAAPTAACLDAIVLTGAGGAGYAGGQVRRRLQSNILSYLNIKGTTGANTTDMSSLSVELAIIAG